MTRLTKIPQAVLAIGMLLVCCWPVSWTTSDPALNQNLWFHIAALLGLVSVLMFGVQNMNTNFLPGLLVLIIMVSHYFSTYEPPGLGLVLNKKWVFSPGTLNFFTIVLGALWYFMIVSCFDKKSVNILMDAICLIALTNLAFIAMQSFGYDPIQKTAGPIEYITGLSLNPGITCGMLAFSVPAFLRGRWKYLIPAVVIGMWMTNSRGGFLALGAGFFVWGIIKGHVKYAVYGAILAALAVVLMSYFRKIPVISTSVGERFQMWEIAWRTFREFWGLGIGPGQWQTALHDLYYQKAQTKTWHNVAHNEIIQCTVEYGFLFLAWLGCYLGNIVRRINKKAILSLTALVIILVNGLVSFPLRVACTGVVILTWLAINEVQLREERI